MHLTSPPTDVTMRRTGLTRQTGPGERKYEVDSLCFPIALALELWKTTGRTDHLDHALKGACEKVTDQWAAEQNHEAESHYRFERDTDKETETLKRSDWERRLPIQA